jgi:TPR repeat protein
VCGKEGGSGASSGGAGASGGVDGLLQHPCPICLDIEDDAGEQPGMCLSCGQSFCSSCNESLAQRGVANCPTCRGVLDVPAKEHAQQLHQLLARPAGRYTQCAQYDLGICYENGHGVVQDPAEAVRWYHLAADQGYARAQYNLGVCYRTGTGVVQDGAEAVRWYRLAADQGFAAAEYNLGVCYANGTGVAQNSAEAVRWYRLAANRGDAGAQFNLGVAYHSGGGVPQDSAEAARWIRLAADQGYAPALAAVAQLGL